MTYMKVAISNLRRNPVRSVLTGLSLAVSAATLCVVLSLDRGYTRAVTEELVAKTGVHMYITKEGCPIEAASVIAQGGLSPLYVAEDMTHKVSAVPEVDVVLPFKLFAITTEDGSRTDIFMGITKEIEKIKPEWRYEKGGWFTSDTSVILGGEMARIENLGIGDKMYSEHFDREFVVAGILPRYYSQDDGTFFIPLKTAQELVDRQGKLSAIAIKLKDISTLDATRNQIRASMPPDYYVLGSKELGEGILEFFGSTRVVLYIMAGVAILISIFSIVNTMLMAVLERRREIAYLKCVGAGAGDLLHLISLETLVICITASAAGAITGSFISPIFGRIMRRYLIAFVPSGSISQPDFAIALVSFIICLVVGVACSLYPAFRASRIVPMEVLRNE
ncbi:MAG: FtsX-like permease family protein [Chitinivibrionales bacterium]|nr:FtsX-like permease family protein [Chitinivibrionales bacterium]MBD3394765.1 FtsX-like permease family protein [Chitinivibrionales bacterium]